MTIAWPRIFTTYELFTFKDGVRYAWVTWQLDGPFAERQCVGVSEARQPC